jgi:hypothetical protein
MAMNKKFLKYGLIAAMAFSSASNAAIFFDRDGSGGGGGVVLTDVFDWAQGNILFQDVVDTSVPVVGQTTLYGHGNLASFLRNGSPVGGPLAGSEFTYVFEMDVAYVRGTNSVTGSPIWGFTVIGGGNFQIFAGATNINTNTGVGFADGALILQGSFLSQPVVNASGSMSVDPAPAATALDQNGANGKVGLTTDTVSGNLNIRIDATYADDNYFLTDVVSSDLDFGFDLDFSTQLASPFTQTNPASIVGGDATDLAGQTGFNAGSAWGATAGPTAPYNVAPNYGGDSRNDASCVGLTCDIHVQTDASSAFTAQAAAAPGTLSILGLSLLGLGVTGTVRRRRNAAAA